MDNLFSVHPSEITIEDIQELAKDDPVIHASLKFYDYDGATVEQCLMLAVTILSKLAKERLDMLVKIASTSPSPMVIVKGED